MKWYEIKNKADKAEIWLYEMIGKDFFTEDGITSKEFQKEISAINQKQIDLHINSPGGSVMDGIGIYNLIKNHPAHVTTFIDGWAASIASIIALAGDEVVMAENGSFMIHNPEGTAILRGDADFIETESQKVTAALRQITDSMIGTYMAKSGKTDPEIRELLKKETWMTAKQAKEFGFIDEIAEEMDMAACAKFIPIMAKAGFKHIPETITCKKEPPDVKSAEKALRDVGFSHKQAKTILAEGFKGYQRDVDPPAAPRDVVPTQKPKVDKVSDLLTRAEIAAPSKQTTGGKI